MKGLILKDFYMMRKSMYIYLFIFIAYSAMGILTDTSSIIMVSSLIFAGMLPANTIAYDEQTHWESYAPTLPLSRKKIIISKYVFGLILTAISFVFEAPVLYLMMIKNPGFIENIGELFLMDISISCVCLFAQAITLPINIKYGTKRARRYVLMVFGIPILLVSIFSAAYLAGKNDLANFLNNISVSPAVAVITFLIITLVVYCISISSSVKIYEKKDF